MSKEKIDKYKIEKEIEWIILLINKTLTLTNFLIVLFIASLSLMFSLMIVSEAKIIYTILVLIIIIFFITKIRMVVNQHNSYKGMLNSRYAKLGLNFRELEKEHVAILKND